MQNLTEKEKAVVRALQGDFPLVADPYAQLAESVGLTKEDFLATVKSMQDEKKIRKMGAVLAHRNVGFKANVLVAWAVPQERLEEVARVMVDSPSVSHCYDRNTAPDWPYNFYTMVHGHSREECEQIVQQLADAAGVQDRQMLFTKKEWKKQSMRYFQE
ncbi:MAG: Lrp/AsnC family transcriptional regulator [Selenomonas sp.]|jgi:DNA-binding Lrp family transcriptional regulator|nr:Lrp/AsnC family transcriptional regulator [Selenomonas sp.]MCI7331660.1 Lrp/AsnC family transcriptional regulator [Selenomonadaceae bacterium]MDD6120782.1 Lrp/AsnC family transcriptional regulator [Selenomonadaceae bacterium]MDD7057126.1 Lrp/AsnC family transcriptional regulator [Selenomonadaceae bacterium]MDY3916040.1 Lrp/AsnC family transcriptional regulator [Selenomonadaceae bacterium]